MIEWKIEDIARVCHEANRAFQVVTNDPAPSPPWDVAPEWQKESAIDGAHMALDGQEADYLHESWCDFKREDGWIYGVAKSAEAKTHPCLVPYDDLPPEQKMKDDIFYAIVQAMTPVDDSAHPPCA